jgi:hypothetical protein
VAWLLVVVLFNKTLPILVIVLNVVFFMGMEAMVWVQIGA